MMDNWQSQHVVKMQVLSCAACGIFYAIPHAYFLVIRRDQREHSCPNGHKNTPDKELKSTATNDAINALYQAEISHYEGKSRRSGRMFRKAGAA